MGGWIYLPPLETPAMSRRSLRKRRSSSRSRRGEDAAEKEEEDKEVHFGLRVCLCGVSVRVCSDG